ncbi:MAG: 2-oxoacid:ferredoxin oxidoreductase subunit gamma [Clostridiales bacterium]|jgi:2-oxoglutarate ferredoxin oxidoreductase subunit gamma|nr:2-oxoacid:ferredoxin oxidoreductase subunit gamma [Clostridiales bacterium]
MSVNHQIFLAGFGGQGILFAGKYLVYTGMMAGYEVSWMPSYGPEMRGGTCNCSVNISDEPIDSPIILHPTILCAMNLPSLDKFENSTVPGGRVFIDSSLIERKPARDDVQNFLIPATGLAREQNMIKLANMILVGKIIREIGLDDPALIEKTMTKVVPAKKPELFDWNMKALQVGMGL